MCNVLMLFAAKFAVKKHKETSNNHEIVRKTSITGLPVSGIAKPCQSPNRHKKTIEAYKPRLRRPWLV